jgi:RimJ/RimL family protein N-acetyltransferase
MATAFAQTTTARQVICRGAFRLTAFDTLMAPVVARWPQDDQELFWLAPKTPPPMSAAGVVAWAGPEGRPLLFYHGTQPEPIGYFEINPMPADFGHYWLGHCVLRPDLRGGGRGRLMISLGLELAFREQRAYRVSLVVFPENVPAIRCYRHAGFVNAGDQYKFFQTTGKQHRMLQMTIDRGQYLSLPLPREFRSSD